MPSPGSLKKWIRENRVLGPCYHGTAQALNVLRHYGDYRQAAEWAKSFDRIIALYGGIGDDLICTAVLRGLAGSGVGRIGVLSEYPELFEENPDPFTVLPKRYPQFIFLERFMGERFRTLLYAPRIDADRSRPPGEHIIGILCRQAGVRTTAALRPFLVLREEEKARMATSQETICLQTSAQGARYFWRNKEWYPERFQKVADAFRGRFRLVQIGSVGDPALDGVEDWRGKTTLRECGAILAQARLFIGLEGFFMHLARSVETRSVIVYGGRLLPTEIGYPCNESVSGLPPCAPCWQDNRCDFNHVCMDMIQPETVIAAVERALDRPRENLETDYFQPETGPTASG
jgi:hypothetical protein